MNFREIKLLSPLTTTKAIAVIVLKCKEKIVSKTLNWFTGLYFLKTPYGDNHKEPNLL